MPIKITIANSFTRYLTSNCWQRWRSRQSVVAPDLRGRDGFGIFTPHQLSVESKSLRNDGVVYSETGPMGVEGRLVKKFGRLQQSAFGFQAQPLNNRLSGALYYAGVRELDLPLTDTGLAEQVFNLLLSHSVRGFRFLRAKHSEVEVSQDRLAITVEDYKLTARQLKRLSHELKKATWPHRYGGEEFDLDIRTVLKEYDVDVLALLLVHSEALDLWELCGFVNHAFEGPNSVARELLSRQNVGRPAILVALANSVDPEIIQKAWEMLCPQLTRNETATITLALQKYCRAVAHQGYCREYLTKMMLPVLIIFDQLLDRSVLLEREALLCFSSADFGLGSDSNELGKIRDQLCLKALEKIFSSLTPDELLAYFDKDDPAVFSVRSRLFEHPRLSDDFCRLLLFECKEQNDNDLAAFIRLRSKLSPEEINDLALKRKNTPALRKQLVQDPALSRNTRFALMHGSMLDPCDPISSECEEVLIAGIKYLWDSLTEAEAISLLPTGHIQADLLLTRSPQISKDFRLAFLQGHLFSTHTYCERMIHKEVILTCLEEWTADFNEDDFKKLYAVLHHWILKHNDVYEAVLFHHRSAPDPVTVARILLTQISYRSMRYYEYLIEGMPSIPADESDFYWLGVSQISDLSFIAFKDHAKEYFERLQKGGLIDQEGNIKQANYELGSKMIHDIKNVLGVDYPIAHAVREIFEQASKYRTLVIQARDLVYLIYFTPNDMDKINRVLNHQKFATVQEDIQSTLAKEMLFRLLSGSRLFSRSKYYKQGKDPAKEKTARFLSDNRLLLPEK